MRSKNFGNFTRTTENSVKPEVRNIQNGKTTHAYQINKVESQMEKSVHDQIWSTFAARKIFFSRFKPEFRTINNKTAS